MKTIGRSRRAFLKALPPTAVTALGAVLIAGADIVRGGRSIQVVARPQGAQSLLTSNLSSRGSKLRGDGDDSGDDDRRTSEKERRKFRKDSCAQQERERGDARFPVITPTAAEAWLRRLASTTDHW